MYTHMGVQRVMQVLAELIYGAPTPVLEHMKIGLSLVLKRYTHTLRTADHNIQIATLAPATWTYAIYKRMLALYFHLTARTAQVVWNKKINI